MLRVPLMRKLKWEKKGLIFDPRGTSSWMQSHAQCPFTLVFDDFVRVFFSTRGCEDSEGQFVSKSAFVDFSRHDLTKILNVSEKPIIDLGGRGTFDEFGSMAGSVVRKENIYYLYYCGWQRSQSTPYNWQIGLATGDGQTFDRYSEGPILGAHLNEPFLQACPIVYKFSNEKWHMFYLSGTKWIEHGNHPESQYLLMHAISNDGITWQRNGKPIIPTTVKDECQTSASIFKRGGTFHMLFSYRHGEGFRNNGEKGYRIGYAWSKNLYDWHRKDDFAGIEIGENSFDDNMIAYPHVFELDGKTNLLYCGNNFGECGFGWAVLNDEH